MYLTKGELLKTYFFFVPNHALPLPRLKQAFRLLEIVIVA